jgi:hypothetical protein
VHEYVDRPAVVRPLPAAAIDRSQHHHTWLEDRGVFSVSQLLLKNTHVP